MCSSKVQVTVARVVEIRQRFFFRGGTQCAHERNYGQEKHELWERT